jgi:hypothetical protein
MGCPGRDSDWSCVLFLMDSSFSIRYPLEPTGFEVLCVLIEGIRFLLTGDGRTPTSARELSGNPRWSLAGIKNRPAATRRNL